MGRKPELAIPANEQGRARLVGGGAAESQQGLPFGRRQLAQERVRWP